MMGINYRFYLSVLNYNFNQKCVEVTDVLASGSFIFFRGWPSCASFWEGEQEVVQYEFKDDLRWSAIRNKAKLVAKHRAWLEMVRERIFTRDFE